MATHQIELRAGTEHDAITIAALAVQVFLDTYATEGVRPDLAREAFEGYSTEAFADRLARPDRCFVLAMHGNALQGFAEVLTSECQAPAAGIRGAELVRLYVQPRAQRSGVGRALLERAEALAAAASLSAQWLRAWDGNPRALAFYARMGYADFGATTYTFQGRTYGNRVLAKRLLAGATAD
jgi:GNAT superfamily N-acetyltransferase